MAKWEYRSEDADNDKLNALGLEGWEAVNVVTDIEHDSYGNKFRRNWVLLKRRIDEPPSLVLFAVPPPDPNACFVCGENHGGLPCPRMAPKGELNG